MFFPVCLWGSSLSFKGHCLQHDPAWAISHLPQSPGTLCCPKCHVHPYPTTATDHWEQILRQCRLFQAPSAGQCWLGFRELIMMLVLYILIVLKMFQELPSRRLWQGSLLKVTAYYLMIYWKIHLESKVSCAKQKSTVVWLYKAHINIKCMNTFDIIWLGVIHLVYEWTSIEL